MMFKKAQGLPWQFLVFLLILAIIFLVVYFMLR